MNFYLLVVETNRYAATVCGTCSHIRPWTDGTVQEMKACLGVLLTVDITVQHWLELSWTTKCPLNIHGVSDVMPINRFQQLFRCLHLADNSAQIPHDDRLFMVRKLLDLLVQRFESKYAIHQDCTTMKL